MIHGADGSLGGGGGAAVGRNNFCQREFYFVRHWHTPERGGCGGLKAILFIFYIRNFKFHANLGKSMQKNAFGSWKYFVQLNNCSSNIHEEFTYIFVYFLD